MWLALLIPLIPYLARRVLISIGIGVITYAGSTALLNHFVSQIQTVFGQASSTGIMFQMASIFGVPDELGIILGAFSTSVSIQTIKKFGFV